ncbi:hypothetical protein PCANC_00349 [Puccinia coronata f. sp. avenae]|uniref:Uncharacterized protein n=1 Tax=Puccinia coronata f. sp. avenae TaxID=200324 RepID=A0A2N5W915_9BASI|nr:hypothetical protein PCANC_00349 [Puccinia coronata f. sp. avenae]
MSAQKKILRTHNVLLHYSSETPAKPQHPLERAGTSNECKISWVSLSSKEDAFGPVIEDFIAQYCGQA